MNIEEKFKEYREKIKKQRREIGKRIVGLDNLINSIFIAFYSHSGWKLVPHILVEGEVGTGKTILMETFAKTIKEAKSKRIQFHPGLKPNDLVEYIDPKTLSSEPGPLMDTNLLLADEINRSTEQTRGGLLEAMAEEQITLGNKTYKLDRPFFVMATENPSDIEGTYSLGAAQLDRFMMMVFPEPLSEQQELEVAKIHEQKIPEIQPVLTKAEVLKIRDFIQENIFVDQKIRRMIIKLVAALRPGPLSVIDDPSEFDRLPKGERGIIFLQRAAKVRAFLQGRRAVIPEDIGALAFPVLNHRIRFKYVLDEYQRIQKTKELIFKAWAKVIQDGVREAAKT